MVAHIKPGIKHKIKDGTPLKLYVISIPPWSEEDHFVVA